MNTWYNVSGAPGSNAFLSSAQIRSEFELIQTAYNTMPSVTQLLSGALNSATTTGSANAYIASIATVTAYADLQRYTLKINVVNTGASTVNISGLGTRTIKRLDGSDVEAGDLGTNKIYDFAYNATTGTVVLLNMMPESVQSDSPSFSTVTAVDINGTTATVTTINGTTVNTTTLTATGNVRAKQVGKAHSNVVTVTGNVTFNLDEFGTFDHTVNGNCAVTLAVTDTTRSYEFSVIATTTGAFNYTSLTMAGVAIYKKLDTTINLQASGKTLLACTYYPSINLLVVMDVDLEAV